MEYSTSTSPPSPASVNRRKLLDELSKGHRAAQLFRRRLMRAPSSSPPLPAGTDDLVSDSALVEVISKSFDIGLAIIKNCDPLSLLDGCKIEESCGGDIGDETASPVKDRRGCYKRRKRGQTWTKEGETPEEDGYQWRKYGQKMILNSQFPRNYYRCTHKMDQGCLAIKQVQKTSDDPPHYKTTYSGYHTCKNPHKTPQTIIPSAPADQSDNSFLLSFDRTTPNNVNNNIPFFQPSHNSVPVKQEQMANNNNNNNNNIVIATQAMMMPMMPMLMNTSPSSEYNYLSSTPVGSDHGGDVISIGEYSCSASPHSLEIDNYMIDLFDCDDI